MTCKLCGSYFKIKCDKRKHLKKYKLIPARVIILLVFVTTHGTDKAHGSPAIVFNEGKVITQKNQL